MLATPPQVSRLPLYGTLALLALSITVGVALRRRRTVVVLSLGIAVVLSGTAYMLGQQAPRPLTAAWTACDLDRGDEDARLQCKISELVTRLRGGELAEVRSMLDTNRDQSCHEVVHAASYHIWRLTHDLDRAASLLLPGCDDGPADELFRLGCYLGTNFRLGDALDAAAWCVEREDFTRQCFEALGENLPYFETPPVTIELTTERALNHLRSCAGARAEDDREACVRSAVRVYAVMRLSAEEGATLCARVAATDRRACTTGVDDARARLANRGIDLG